MSDSTAPSVLKGCPCCAATAKTHEQDNAEGYRHFAECDACCLRTDNYLTASAAIAAWNRRAADPVRDEIRDSSLSVGASTGAPSAIDAARRIVAWDVGRAADPWTMLESVCEPLDVVAVARAYIKAVEALERIDRWHGEFPETGRFWDREKTQPMSYGAAFGSNGERDFMRDIARAALSCSAPQPETSGSIAPNSSPRSEP